MTNKNPIDKKVFLTCDLIVTSRSPLVRYCSHFEASAERLFEPGSREEDPKKVFEFETTRQSKATSPFIEESLQPLGRLGLVELERE